MCMPSLDFNIKKLIFFSIWKKNEFELNWQRNRIVSAIECILPKNINQNRKPPRVVIMAVIYCIFILVLLIILKGNIWVYKIVKRLYAHQIQKFVCFSCIYKHYYFCIIKIDASYISCKMSFVLQLSRYVNGLKSCLINHSFR